ncbi:MAG: hypothetical protein ACE5J5_01960, partial [Candidatus Hydrothermarchaeales archaeon]
YTKMNINHIKRALKEVRDKSHDVLNDIYQEVVYEADVDRSLASYWVQNAVITAREDQKLTIDLIKARLDATTDEEEKKEVEKELEVAKAILGEIGEVITDGEAKKRVWNLRDYENFR